MTLDIKAVSTTVSCQVSGGEGYLSAEIDSRPFGLNGGKSQWFPGDTCYVLVYKSSNVRIVGTAVTSAELGTTFGPAEVPRGFDVGTSGVGYNVIREGITFNNPISASSKPMPRDTKVLNELYPGGLCGGFQFIPDTTIARLTDWRATGDPAAIPPYGFVFVEYSPTALIYAFKNLPHPPTGLFSYPVHAVIYGIATPAMGSFK